MEDHSAKLSVTVVLNTSAPVALPAHCASGINVLIPAPHHVPFSPYHPSLPSSFQVSHITTYAPIQLPPLLRHLHQGSTRVLYYTGMIPLSPTTTSPDLQVVGLLVFGLSYIDPHDQIQGRHRFHSHSSSIIAELRHWSHGLLHLRFYGGARSSPLVCLFPNSQTHLAYCFYFYFILLLLNSLCLFLYFYGAARFLASRLFHFSILYLALVHSIGCSLQGRLRRPHPRSTSMHPLFYFIFYFIVFALDSWICGQPGARFDDDYNIHITVTFYASGHRKQLECHRKFQLVTPTHHLILTVRVYH